MSGVREVGVSVGRGIAILSLLAGLRAPGALRAQAVAPHATARADTTEIHVGDRLGVHVEVRHAATQTVVWPDSLDLSPFEAVAFREDGARASEEGAVRSAATVTVTAFQLGELELPSIDVALVGAAGDTSTVRTDPIGIGVVSVGLDESGDIRGVRGPLSIGRAWVSLWPWARLALVVAGVAYWWIRKRRARPVGDRRPAGPPRPAHEIALEALARIEACDLLERGEIKRYHIEVSQVVRSYIEDRYGIQALEMITPQLVSGLRRVGVAPEVCERFRGFLEACDLVKFAKHRPVPDACRAILARARELVEATKVVPPPAESDAGDDDASREPEAA